MRLRRGTIRILSRATTSCGALVLLGILIMKALNREPDPPGPYVVEGTLFFRLLDGSVLNCICIKEPWASKVVAACRERKSS